MTDNVRFVIGAGLKMYLAQRETIRWAERVAHIAGQHPAVSAGFVDLFVLPSFPALAPVAEVLAGTGVRVGAQDLFWEDRGAFTGEVSGADLAELGCSLVEVGHAERRRVLGETEEIVAAKTLAAFRNDLTPILCVGETQQLAPAAAGEECVRQLASATLPSRQQGLLTTMLIAYEPQWAIGAVEPAHPEYIVAVVRHLNDFIDGDSALAGSTVLYGGSAGPGLLPQVDGVVGGLFLGRSCHEPTALESVLDEAWQLV